MLGGDWELPHLESPRQRGPRDMGVRLSSGCRQARAGDHRGWEPAVSGVLRRHSAKRGRLEMQVISGLKHKRFLPKYKLPPFQVLPPRPMPRPPEFRAFLPPTATDFLESLALPTPSAASRGTYSCHGLSS